MTQKSQGLSYDFAGESFLSDVAPEGEEDSKHIPMKVFNDSSEDSISIKTKDSPKITIFQKTLFWAKGGGLK